VCPGEKKPTETGNKTKKRGTQTQEKFRKSAPPPQSGQKYSGNEIDRKKI